MPLLIPNGFRFPLQEVHEAVVVRQATVAAMAGDWTTSATNAGTLLLSSFRDVAPTTPGSPDEVRPDCQLCTICLVARSRAARPCLGSRY